MNNDTIELSVKDGEKPNTKKVTAKFTVGTDKALMDKAGLGKTRQTCKLCGASGGFQTWLGIEMFVGTRDEFRYFECPECETLQIETFPEDIGKYYAHDYYSFRQPQFQPVDYAAPRDGRMILDVGCGAGSWLCSMAAKGCVNLYGCDPFIKENLLYQNGVKIKKCSIHEMEGQYDVIHLSHSFEHMPDPHEVFKSFDRLLKRGKGEYGDAPKIEIRIPIFPNLAFDIYGPYWYQMDPPRHYFLHSVKSIGMLADQSGFCIAEARYEGGGGQFTVSRLYQLGVPFLQYGTQINNNPAYAGLKAQLPAFEALSSSAVAAGRSDQAAFTLVRK